jgi:hypothetical protein
MILASFACNEPQPNEGGSYSVHIRHDMPIQSVQIQLSIAYPLVPGWSTTAKIYPSQAVVAQFSEANRSPQKKRKQIQLRLHWRATEIPYKATPSL